MIKISNTTLCCVDCINQQLSIKAIERCMENCQFEKALLITNQKYQLENIEVVHIQNIETVEDYSLFIFKELIKYIQTDFVLIVQYDGFIVNPNAWTVEFQDYDYIGAKWFWFSDGLNVGNGGFSLRSKRLLQATTNIHIPVHLRKYGEDALICRAYRGLLENTYGIRFASESAADKFSHEFSEPICDTFGFHGLFNIWRYVPSAELFEFIELLSLETLKSRKIIDLGMKCHSMGQFKQAEFIYRKILKSYPYNSEVLDLLNMLNKGIKPNLQLKF